MTVRELDRWMYLSGTSEQRLASMVGRSRNSIRLWRNGIVQPRNGNLVALNEAILRRNTELLEALDLGYIDETLCSAQS